MAPLRPYGYGHHVVRGRRVPYSLYPQMRLLVFLDLAYEQGIRTRLVQLGMKIDRIRTDIIDIIFVFIFLCSDSNTDNVNYVG